MRIKIYPREVILARNRTKQFDKQKTFNKFVCKNNYIGYLGELVLHRYLNECNIEHEWVPFIKQGTESADFIIDGRAIDLKCSTSGELWVTPHTPHDIYISAQITPACDYLYINGWLGRDILNKVKYNHARKVVRGSRTAYVISNAYLLPVDLLFKSTKVLVIKDSKPIDLLGVFSSTPRRLQQ